MARPSYPKSSGPPPPALPPAAQTVGQVVAETIRTYGERFLLAVPLGVPLMVADQIALATGRSSDDAVRTVGGGSTSDVLTLVAASPAFSLGYAAACALVLRLRPSPARLALATVAGTVLFAPAAAFFPWFALVSVAWLALVGHTVPAIVAENLGPVAALRRSWQLARADYVHALGGLAALVVLFGLTRIVMAQLLKSQADNTLRVAVALADLVLSPLLYIGGVLIFVNLTARVGLDREARKSAREEAIAAMHTDRHTE